MSVSFSIDKFKVNCAFDIKLVANVFLFWSYAILLVLSIKFIISVAHCRLDFTINGSG